MDKASQRGTVTVGLGVLSGVLGLAGFMVFAGSYFTNCPHCPDSDADIFMVGASVLLLTDAIGLAIAAGAIARAQPPRREPQRSSPPISIAPGRFVLRF